MILDIPVFAIMTEDVIVVGAGDELRDVANTFNNDGSGMCRRLLWGCLAGMLSWIRLKKMPGFRC